MRQRATWQKLKTFGSFCLIMLLLPYIVTVFVILSTEKILNPLEKRRGICKCQKAKSFIRPVSVRKQI